MKVDALLQKSYLDRLITSVGSEGSGSMTIGNGRPLKKSLFSNASPLL